MPTNRDYKVYTIVYRSTPLDLQMYRHVALLFKPSGKSSSYYFNVVGSTGEFEFEMRKDFDPTSSGKFEKKIKVAKLSAQITSSYLNQLMEGVPIVNENPEFNCQVWVDYALYVLCQQGYITNDEYVKGRNEMVDATMEARDDEHYVA
ncbi:hypothetical protein BGZ63DRAFT_368398 [Mariannaea sp. PMI_226]|nr:hypothetical protein BGZ63DRAFT_368398 [Mariannaea sp. PMI_226]